MRTNEIKNEIKEWEENIKLKNGRKKFKNALKYETKKIYVWFSTIRNEKIFWWLYLYW